MVPKRSMHSFNSGERGFGFGVSVWASNFEGLHSPDTVEASRTGLGFRGLGVLGFRVLGFRVLGFRGLGFRGLGFRG